MVSLELEARLDNLLSTAQTEMANIDLFTPMEREECEICMLPMPINSKENTFMQCCGKRVCIGCDYRTSMTTNAKNGRQRLTDKCKCAFCRQPGHKNFIKANKKFEEEQS